ALARPSIGLITNAGEAHLEGFGGIEGVVRGKGEMYAGVQDGGTCIINADQPWQDEWRERAGSRRVITFGQAGAHDFHVVGGIDEADGQLRFSMVTPDGEVQVALPMAGRHNVKNALAAAAAAWSCGCSLAEIQAGLAVARNVSGRMHVEQLADDIELVDDTYNANPLSMRAAAEWLAGRGRPGWLVMGDMGELGPEEQQLHEDVGRFAAEQGVTRFYAVGELSKHAAKGFGADARHFDSVEALIEALTADIKTGITVLVKGSRAARMERVVAALRLGGTA
ncbi:MAG: Mur ligase family protein, partial [Gammaproteobacteria bacterium]|nr:Mur ligase family protein [Gammaproteobacteria bacterium]